MEPVPEILQIVDNGKIGLTPAEELSHLKPKEQVMLLTTIESEQAIPSLSQAQRMKQQSKDGELTEAVCSKSCASRKSPVTTVLIVRFGEAVLNDFA